MVLSPEPRLGVPVGGRAGGSMDMAGARWMVVDKIRCLALSMESRYSQLDLFNRKSFYSQTLRLL